MKCVVITGTSRGIGEATAQKFIEEGWTVIGTSTSGTVPYTHENLHIHQLDLADPESIVKFSGEIIARKEDVDVLINNAGISLSSDTDPISADVLRKTLEVNLIGTVGLTEALLPVIRDGGHIISLSSGLASLTEDVGTWAPAYKISKAGLNMFTKHLAAVLHGRRITVSSFDPGWVKTDMGGMNAPREPFEPARELFELATSAVDSGDFWRGTRKRSW